MVQKDKRILEYIRDGNDEAALSLLYKQSLPKIRKYILRNSGSEEDVKDIFQDTIVIFYRQIKTGKFKDVYDIDAYLYTIARNLYIRYVNRYTNRNRTMLLEETDTAGDQLQEMIGKEKEEAIDRLFSSLGGRCSDLLKLALFDGLSMKKIAERLGYLNEDVAKSASYKCRQRLSALVKSNPALVRLFRS